MTDFVTAESGVRQLYARCIDAVWRKDTAAFADCFTEDGEWKIAGRHLRGRAEIGNGFEELLSPNERVLMIFGPPLLQVGSGAAQGRCYVTEMIKRKDKMNASTIGTYYEHFVEQADQWRFQSRYFSLHYYGPADLSAPIRETTNFGPPPGMPGENEPAVFHLRDQYGHPHHDE